MNSETTLVIRPGDKLLACHRRLFDNDQPRFFVGEVLSSNDSVIKVRGYSLLRDLSTGHFERKKEVRTKVVSVVAGTHIFYQLPDDVPVDSIKVQSIGGKVGLHGEGGFTMDLTEHSIHRA